MTDRARMRDLARILLLGIRFERFIGDDGRPTSECWDALDEGRLSTGEHVLVALALAIVDHQVPSPPTVDRLLLLDRHNLARVAGVLGVLSEVAP